MTGVIDFPNLGLTLHHVGNGINIGSFRIAFYGIIIALGMSLGIALVTYIAGRTDQNPDNYFNFAILTMVVAVIGARIYYVIFSWDYYGAYPLEILNFRAGGLAIYGGIIAGVVNAIAWCRVKKQKVLLLLDTCMVGLPLGQAIGRWGNFFNREAFGGFTDGLLAMGLPVQDVRSGELTESILSRTYVKEGLTFIQVHPTFLYESMWNLALTGLLVLVTLKLKKKFDGEVFLLYLLGYGIGRFWIEGLRTDQLRISGTQIAVSQLLSAVLAVTAALFLILGMYRYYRKNS